VNKFLLPLVFVSTLSILVGNQQAFALNCESQQTGDWDQLSTWQNCGGGIPSSTDNITIKTLHVVTLKTTETVSSILNIEGGAELFVEGNLLPGKLIISGGTFTNGGKVTINGGTSNSFAQLRLVDFSIGTNECTGIINTIGGIGFGSGAFVLLDSQFVNKGIINLLGGVGEQSGALGVGPGTTVNNHGIVIENAGSGPTSGVVNIKGFFNDNLASLCGIGGELLPIDSTALLLAGAQMNAAWMIPVIVSAIGFAIVIARKF